MAKMAPMVKMVKTELTASPVRTARTEKMVLMVSTEKTVFLSLSLRSTKRVSLYLPTPMEHLSTLAELLVPTVKTVLMAKMVRMA